MVNLHLLMVLDLDKVFPVIIKHYLMLKHCRMNILFVIPVRKAADRHKQGEQEQPGGCSRRFVAAHVIEHRSSMTVASPAAARVLSLGRTTPERTREFSNTDEHHESAFEVRRTIFFGHRFVLFVSEYFIAPAEMTANATIIWDAP